MKRAIDSIIEALQQRFPDLTVVQMHKTHPADDDGLWWFRLPGIEKDIQIESSNGNCPFLIEHGDMLNSRDAITGHTLQEVVETVGAYLASLKAASERS